MNRYENTKIKKSQVSRGKTISKSYNLTSYNSIVYSSIPESDDDTWVITQPGDRLDTLAYQFYGDTTLWWYIAKANKLSFITLENNTSIRIPGDKKYAIGI